MKNPNSRDRQRRPHRAPFIRWALLGLLSACTQNEPSDKTSRHVAAGCEFLEPREEEPECGGLAERCAQVQGETREREFVLTLDDTDLSTKELERRTKCLADSLELEGAGVQEGQTRAGSVVVHGTWEELQYFVHAQALLAFDVSCDAEGALCRDCDGRREEECVADAYCQVIRGTRIDLERACLGERAFLLCASEDTCDDATLVAMNEDGEAFYTECDELAGYEYSYDEAPPSVSCADVTGLDAGDDAGADPFCGPGEVALSGSYYDPSRGCFGPLERRSILCVTREFAATCGDDLEGVYARPSGECVSRPNICASTPEGWGSAREHECWNAPPCAELPPSDAGQPRLDASTTSRDAGSSVDARAVSDGG